MTRATVRRELGAGETISGESSLWVPHITADGRTAVKMVGQCIRHRGQVVFHHAQSGTQYHRKFDAPCPLDLELVTLLYRSGIALVYCYDRQRKLLLRTDLERLKDAVLARYDGRMRLYQALRDWDVLRDISEHQDAAERVYARADGYGAEVMRIPFIALELVIPALGSF